MTSSCSWCSSWASNPARRRPTARPRSSPRTGKHRLRPTFPAQAATEVRVPPLRTLGDGSWLGLDWAASSRLEFAVPAGTTIPLTADAVLAALRTLAVVPSPPGSVERTELELPAGLKTSPVPANGTDPVLARHPVALRQNLHATALPRAHRRVGPAPPTDVGRHGVRRDPLGWRLGPRRPQRLRRHTAELPADPGDLRADPPVVGGGGHLPGIGRLRPSALGATLTVTGDWATASWQHDLALGRDRRVRFLQRGGPLPFGHTASLVEVAERQVSDTIHADSGTETGRAAVMLRTTLFIDTVRTFPDDGSAAARAFPFDRVEVLTPTIENLDDPRGDRGPAAPAHAAGHPDRRPGAAPRRGDVLRHGSTDGLPGGSAHHDGRAGEGPALARPPRDRRAADRPHAGSRRTDRPGPQREPAPRRRPGVARAHVRDESGRRHGSGRRSRPAPGDHRR